METIPLTAVARSYGYTAALKDGTVQPAGFTWAFEEVPVLIQAFRRMVRELEFDVSEMAFGTYLCAREHGVRFTAIPVFPARGFHHETILVNAKAGISGAGDLVGKRVGVNRGWTVTTGVWARGILARDYGVDLSRINWVLSGDEHVVGYQPPANVTPAPAGKDLGRMLMDGELDAAIGVQVDDPAVVPLFHDAAGEAERALRNRGLYPINHLVVIRDEVLAKHPDAARAVFDAFVTAKQEYLDRLAGQASSELSGVDRMLRRVQEVTAADPLPYGVAGNKATLEELISHALAQQVIHTAVTPEEIFAETTREISG